MPVRGLTIIVASADQARLRSAIGLALSQAALGGAVRLFIDTAAVALLRSPIVGHDDALHVAAGLPSLAGLIEEALEANVRLTLCQAGMAMADATASDFDPRIDFGGMIALLAELDENRLVMA